MRLRDLLEEANRVLYHYTSLWSLGKILKERRIGLTYATGSDIQAGSHNQEKVYFLSTTRSKIGHYTKAHEGASGAVVLVLNADFIARSMMIRPVDYWGREFRLVDPKRNEMEERVYSKFPYLELPANPSDVILAAHLFVDPTDERLKRTLSVTIMETKRLGIPLYAYRDKRAWLLQDIRRAMPVAELIQILRGIPRQPPLGRGGASFRFPSRFGGYVELYTRPVTDRDRLTEQGKNLLRRVTPWGLANGDAFRSLDAEMHGERSPSSLHHDDFVRFVEFLRKIGMPNVKDFLAHLSQKWYAEPQR